MINFGTLSQTLHLQSCLLLYNIILQISGIKYVILLQYVYYLINTEYNNKIIIIKFTEVQHFTENKHNDLSFLFNGITYLITLYNKDVCNILVWYIKFY